MEKNMTALVSCFARGYHYKNNKYWIFKDNLADQILTKEEYEKIANSMVKGIKFFNPNFEGSEEEALRWIVDNQLSPSVLGRSIFCEKSLFEAMKIGCKQYLIFAAGYDTFAYRYHLNNLEIFEIDKKDMLEDKIRRLENIKIDYSKVNFLECDFTNKNWINNIINSNYKKDLISFSSLLGISYYLEKEEFKKMLKDISCLICNGSSIVFDYPTYEDSKETKINEKLASGANEKMKAKYSYQEIENILEENDLLIYEHLNNEEMTKTYFAKYNLLNPNNKIIAPKGVNYCLAIKNKK